MPQPPNHQPQKPEHRPRCPHCLRALSGCICAIARPIKTDTTVTIIQHPSEERRWKGTGRLLHLCLPSSRLIVEENIPATLLDSTNQHTVLLYPAESDEPQIDSNDLCASNTQLIILDGTWRKSRKLLHLNPALNALPRLRLPDPIPTSHYRIRKAEKDGQLATIEAAALALDQLEPQHAVFDHLSNVFEAFVTHIEAQEARFKGTTPRSTLE